MSWSPDGRYFACADAVNYGYRLTICGCSRPKAALLTVDPSPDSGPRWSADEHEIAFVSIRRGNSDIWAMPADGGAPRPFTSHPAME